MSLWKWTTLTAASCILVSVLSGYVTASWMTNRAAVKPAAKMSAQEFVLVNETGHVGAKIAWKDGEPAIQLFDRSNHLRSALFLEPNGVPDLYLYDQNNAVRAALNLFDSGVPNLAFLDPSQQHMVYTEYDPQRSYNTVFAEIGKDGNKKIATRRIRADENGLHVSDIGGPAVSK